MVQTQTDYALIQLDKTNYKLIVAAFETGRQEGRNCRGQQIGLAGWDVLSVAFGFTIRANEVSILLRQRPLRGLLIEWSASAAATTSLKMLFFSVPKFL